MRLYYQIEHLDSNCKAIRKTRKLRARSFVRAFLSSLYVKVSTLAATFPDYTNTSASRSDTYIHLFWHGLQGKAQVKTVYNYVGVEGGTPQITRFASNIIGVVVGSGTNAVTSSDYALQTQIANGSASGQLEYGSNMFTETAVAAPSATLTVSRIFRNSSGGAVVVREVGIYGVCGTAVFCHVRDVLGAGAVTMADGDYLKITYTLTVTA